MLKIEKKLLFKLYEMNPQKGFLFWLTNKLNHRFNQEMERNEEHPSILSEEYFELFDKYAEGIGLTSDELRADFFNFIYQNSYDNRIVIGDKNVFLEWQNIKREAEIIIASQKNS